MTIETKELYVGTYQKKQSEIKIRGYFGWEYVEDKHYGRSGTLHIVLKRDKDLTNYKKLDELEKRYDNYKKQIKTYSPISDSPEMFLLILLLIFPFVIYCVYKHNQKIEIRNNNGRLIREMNEIIKEAKTIEKI